MRRRRTTKIAKRSSFNTDTDLQVNEMRMQGMTWDAIGLAIFGRVRFGASVLARARVAKLPCLGLSKPEAAPRELTEREAFGTGVLPPMHPIAWAVLCDAPRLEV